VTPALNNVITVGAAAATPGQTAGQYQLEQIIGYTGAYTGTWPSLSPDTAASPAGKSIGEGKTVIKGAQYTNSGSPVTSPATYHGLRTIATALDASTAKGDPKFTYPYDAYAYLRNPQLSTINAANAHSGDVARQKDGFILISAGPDRIYGTEDDITSFGSVGD